MTNTQHYLINLGEDMKARIGQLFISFDKFYPAVYLLVKNEHLTNEEKPERFEDRLSMIAQVRRQTESFLTGIGLSGVDLYADIASDYFEDYVNYREPEFELTNEEFLGIVRNIMSLQSGQ